MAHQSESVRFQALFDHALQAYEQKAGVSLTQHPLAIKLQSCDSVEAIIGLLQNQAQAFKDLQGSDKIMKSLKATISILSKLSSAASLAGAFGLVRQKGLMLCLTSLTFYFHLRRRYRFVSLSYLTYVPFSGSYVLVDDLVTSCDSVGQRHNIQLRRTRRLARVDRTLPKPAQYLYTNPSYARNGRDSCQDSRGAHLHARSGDRRTQAATIK